VIPSFETKLKEMEKKLPPKLVKNENGDGFVNYDKIVDKEFCYKFLYCYLNNIDNQTDEIKSICRDIFNVYKIENGTMEDFFKEDFSTYDKTIIRNITFEIGFIIHIEVISKGGSTPTQKRRPRKSNHTIKNREKTR
jgi:hypothetical protein